MSYKDAGELAPVAASTLRLNNSFFTGIGLLEKTNGSDYIPSEEVISFQRAHQWDPDSAAEKLAPALRKSWFGEALIPRLTMKDLSEKKAVQVLAETSGATPEYENQLVMLLDYLDEANLIDRDGEMVRKGELAYPGRRAREEKEGKDPEAGDDVDGGEPETSTQQPPGGFQTGFQAGGGGAVQFGVDVTVDMAEMAEWEADRITAFFNGIAQVLAAKGQMERSMTE